MRGHGGGSGSSGGSGGSGSSGGPNLIQISKMRSTSSPTDVKNE